jgi:uncharacterized protein (DUF305 family)
MVAANGAQPTTQPSPAAAGAGPADMQQPNLQQPQPIMGAGPSTAMCVCAMGAVAVDNNAIYMASGDQLYKLDKNNMSVLNCVTLPLMQQSQAAVGGAGPMDTQQGTQQDQFQTMNTQPGAAGAGPGNQQQGATMGAGPGNGGMMCVMPTIAVDDSFVYVVRGNQLLKLGKDNLQIQSTAMLPVRTTQMAMMMSPSPGMTMGAGPMAISASCPAGIGLSGAGPSAIQAMQGQGSSQVERVYMGTALKMQQGAIAWSELAQQRATRAELRNFAADYAVQARQMQDEYTDSLRDWYGVRMSDVQMPPDYADTYSNLQSMSGQDFDIAYMCAMQNHFSQMNQLNDFSQRRTIHAPLRRSMTEMTRNNNQMTMQIRTWLVDWYNIMP